MNTSPQTEEFIIAPRELCQSCHAPSGPKFALSALRDTYSVLRTAIPFTEHDRDIADCNVAYAQSQGVLIDQEILRIQQCLEVLRRRRHVLRRFEELERGVLSPIGKLPVEILRNIFLLVQDGNIFLSGSRDDLTVFPRVAGQVSSYWRSVSRSCAPLWSDISCDILKGNGTSDCIPKWCGRLIEDCVRYSQGMPLSLQLWHHITSQLLGDSCVSALGQCSNRWKNVIFSEGDLVKDVFASVPEGFSMEYLETLELGNVMTGTLTIPAAPKLRSLIIDGGDVEDDEDPNHIHVSIESAPSLVRLDVRTMYSPLTALTGITWSNIMHYTSNDNYYRTDELITLLEGMTNLVSLRFYGETGTNRHIEMPRLEALMTGELTDSESNILTNLVAPHLQKISIEWDTVPTTFTVPFVRRSGCIIRELELKYKKIDYSWRVSEFSNVKTLLLEEPFIAGDSIKRLKYENTHTTGDMFPKLETLHIKMMTVWPGQDFDRSITILLDTLNSRLRRRHAEAATRTYLKAIILHIEVLEDEHDTILTQFFHSELVVTSGVQIEIQSYRSHSDISSLSLKNF